MNFLVDMPLSPGLASWLKIRGHDVVHAAEVGLDRAADEDVIAYGRAETRIVITADLDYPRILALSDADRPGLILFRGGEWSQRETERRLHTVLATLPREQLESSIVVVEKSRIRKRTLPLR